MDWQLLVDEGVVHPAPLGPEHSHSTIRRAWDRVLEARVASLEARWDTADREIRHAFCVATEALAAYHSFKLDERSGFDTARRIGAEYFGERLAEPIFERACGLRKILPLERELDPAQVREVRRSIAASSEYVALVECFTYQG